MGTIDTVKVVWKHGSSFIKRNLPTIMTVGAGIGVAVTVGLAIKATPSAVEKIRAKEEIDPDMTTLQKVAVGAPDYAATIMAFAITEGLMFGANHMNLKRIATISALYSALSADKKTKEKVLSAAEEIIGKEKMDDIKKAVGMEEKTPKEAVKNDDDILPGEAVSSTAAFSGRYEKRPCRLTYNNQQIGETFINSFNGIDEAMSDCACEAETYGAVSMDKVMSRLKMSKAYIGSILALDKDMDYSITADKINGATGWNVELSDEPLIDYDASLRRSEVITG